MARPRTISDERLLAAAAAVIGRRGPSFTVAEVATEAGVAAGTLIGRFGSRRGLVEALGRAGAAAALERMRAAAAGAGGGGSAAVLAALLTGAEDLDDPATAANHLAQLGADLVDPGLRDLLREDLAARRRAVAALVAAADDLPGAPAPERAAGLLLALVNGVQLSWSLEPSGSLVARLRRDAGAVLGAWGPP